MNPQSFKFLLSMGSGTLSAGILSALLTHQLLRKALTIQLFSIPSLKPMKKLSRPQLVLVSCLFMALLVMLFVDYFPGFLLAVFVAGIWYAVEKGPALKKKFEMERRQGRMADVFPQTLGMAIQALKTGQNIPQVLEYLSRECPSPLKEELSQVSMEMGLGSSAEQALSQMAERFPDFPEFHQFVESYMISRQTGANLTHLLEVLLDGMEEKSRLLRKMTAMTSQARLSGIMMGILPFLLAFVFFIMDPDLMTPLFTEKIGWAILLLAAGLEAIGFLWIRQLLQLEV